MSNFLATTVSHTFQRNFSSYTFLKKKKNENLQQIPKKKKIKGKTQAVNIVRQQHMT